MVRKLSVFKGLFLVAISMQLGLSEEKQPSVVDTTSDYFAALRLQIWEHSLNRVKNVSSQLRIENQNMTEKIRNIMESDHIPLLNNILNDINNHPEVQSIKTVLPRSKPCTNLFGKLILALALNFQKKFEDEHHNELVRMLNLLKHNDEMLDFIQNDLSTNYDYHLQNCLIRSIKCNIKYNEKRIVKEIIQYVEDSLPGVDEAVKTRLRLNIGDDINNSLILPVKKCLDNKQ